jgi:hypothetical protein
MSLAHEINGIILLVLAVIVVSIASAVGFWLWVSPLEIHMAFKALGTMLVLLFSFKMLSLIFAASWWLLKFLGENAMWILCFLFEFVAQGIELLWKSIKTMRRKARE